MTRDDMMYQDALLLLAADTLDDLERARIAMENRVRSLEQVKGISDGPELARVRALAAATLDLEHRATLDLKRAVRQHYLGAWIKATIGVGEKQGARLLGALGNPRWNDADQRARRGPAELWQYCGHGDPARSRRRRGEKVQFSPQAKMRTHLIAESCIKQAHSPYRPVYDAARASWAEREVSDMHAHNHALRLVGKAILRDLYLATPAFAETSLPLAA